MRFVWGFIPVAVVVTDDLPEGSTGQSHGLSIWVRAGYEYDEALIQHELTHVRQMLRGLWVFHTLLWSFSDRYQMYCEACAYKVEMRYPNANGTYATLEEVGERLSRPIYGFGITPEQGAAYIGGL